MIAWVRRWGWLIGFIAIGVFILIITAGKVRPNFKAELDAAKADARADELAAELGHVKAIQHIEEEYAETIETMVEEDKKQAERLADDPRARARLYARIAARRPS